MEPKDLKNEILSLLLEQTRSRLKSAQESYQSALSHSRSDDMKSEGKYDTRAIEAGYLASAKKQRVAELEVELHGLEKLNIGPRTNASMGSLILASENLNDLEIEKLYFIAPCSGEKIEVESQTVFVISPGSPMGKEILGLEADDAIEIETPKGPKEIHILEIN